MRESDIEAYLVAQVGSVGGECRKFTSPGHRGVADRICFFPTGLVILAETKRPKGGVISVSQQREAWRMSKVGTPTYFLDSKSSVDTLIALAVDQIAKRKHQGAST